MERYTITTSSVASPEQQIVMIDSDSNEPTFPFGFGSQHPIVPPSLNDLNLPPNPFSLLATVAVFQPDKEYSPQSPELFVPSPIPTPPLNLTTIEGWETTLTTTDDNTFYSEEEPRRVCWDTFPSELFDSNETRHVAFASSPSSTSPPPRRQKRKPSMRMPFPQKGGESQHTCEAWGQPVPAKKTPWCSEKTQTSILLIKLLTMYF